MSRPAPYEPGRLSEEADVLARELSARTVLFHDAVAACVGLSTTEHKCLDLLERAGTPLTAGQLAQLSGLTTGAITGIVDRLESAGFVARERSVDDRRKVLVHTLPKLREVYGPIMGGIAQVSSYILARYRDEELAVIVDFVRRSIEGLKTETARLRQMSGPEEGGS
jgi:DNA-binding MarR family transcriptional regulator